MRSRRGRAVFLSFALCSCSTERDLIDEYRRTDFGDPQNWPALDDSYRSRIALEFEIIRSAPIERLREGMHDPVRHVRALSTAALGIRGDHASGPAIAKLIEDPRIDGLVGGAALQALGWLKSGLETVRSARTTSRTLGRHLLDLAERQIQDPIDHAAAVRDAYRLGLRWKEVGSAAVGKPAPDFAAVDTDGKAFRLAEVLREKRVAILVFVSADW